LRKVLLHLLMGVAVGLLIVLIPLFAVTETKGEMVYGEASSLSERLRGLEGSYSQGVSRPSLSGLEILTVCFVVAAAVYLLVKRRVPGRDYRRFRVVPS
jgi:hypothetical protein